jgi:hypothetical protein
MLFAASRHVDASTDGTSILCLSTNGNARQRSLDDLEFDEFAETA